MTHQYPARVAEISLTTGLGPIAVNGIAQAVNVRTFDETMEVGDTVYLGVAHRDKNEWEEGLYTYIGVNRFARTVILQSSSGGPPVNFTAGIKDVWATIPSIATQRADENVMNTGVATLDFGVWPGSTDASVNIVDQLNIVATSYLVANLIATTTDDHDEDEVWVDPPIIVVGEIVPGTGFTIHALAREDNLYGQYQVTWMWK